MASKKHWAQFGTARQNGYARVLAAHLHTSLPTVAKDIGKKKLEAIGKSAVRGSGPAATYKRGVAAMSHVIHGLEVKAGVRRQQRTKRIVRSPLRKA